MRPTPIDPADIRPGDVVRVVEEFTIVKCDDYMIHGGGYTFSTGDVPGRTWHLVHRPDPDAEAVEALAEFLHEDSGCEDAWPCQSGAPYHRNRARAALDLVRRAES